VKNAIKCIQLVQDQSTMMENKTAEISITA